jgi:predicted metalloprotease with PDZ domain
VIRPAHRSPAFAARLALAALAGLAALAAPAPALAADGAIRLEVDLSEAPRRIFHARMEIPVAPGTVTLHYPKWIPGEHGPTGPIVDVAGLRFSAGGQELAWRRDPLDMFAFSVDVPAGATTLAVALDYLTPSGAGQFTSGPASSAKVAVLSWNTVVLYPAGRPAAEVTVQPALVLPPGWGFGTALEETTRAGDRVEFAPVSLMTLVDSPVAAGAHHRTLALSEPGAGPLHTLEMVADSAAALAMPAAAEAAYRRLDDEALALFGAAHYRYYRFLLTLSDHVESFGLEHHESSDNRLPERSLLDPDLFEAGAGLLPHEMVHSWNGKYRRPAGLATPHYHAPFVDDLLWVYEGLTSYLGTVLTARSGLHDAAAAREYLALLAAGLDHRPGRTWRPLGDTARAAQVLFGSRQEWSSWRRGVDFYDEGVLTWLDADVTIRRATGGARSLDDFCRRFYGPPGGPPKVVPYSFDDLVAALEATAAHDWRAFFAARIDRVAPRPPLAGFEDGGWSLAYTAEPNALAKAIEAAGHTADLRFSLGLVLRDREGAADHGTLLDVVPGLPAAAAGAAPGMRLVAVGGRRWSKQVLRDALAAAAAADSGGGAGAIELLVENDEFFATLRVDHRGGERHPHLQRREGVPDLLSEILAAKAGG